MKPLSEKTKKILFTILSLIALAAFWTVLFFVAGKPMLEMVGDPEGFRAWVEAHGMGGRVLFIGFMVLQVLVSVIPSEPLEIGAGYAFGAIEGAWLCLLGIGIGTAMIFAFVRKFGSRVVEFFISREQIDSFSFLNTEKRLRTVTFLLYFIPGIPKDIVTWIVPLTRIRFLTFILLSSIARIFSIVTSTVSGSALGEEKYTTAIAVFAVTAAVSGICYLIYRFSKRKHPKSDEKYK